MCKQPHKWAKEIKAWADGAKIEVRDITNYSNPEQAKWTPFEDFDYPIWLDEWEYRIKPELNQIKGYLILTKLGFTSTVYQSLKGAKAAAKLYPFFNKIIEVTETIEV